MAAIIVPIVKADQWMKCRGVEERILELRRENDRKATLTREQMLTWLTRVITTGAGDVSPSPFFIHGGAVWAFLLFPSINVAGRMPKPF